MYDLKANNPTNCGIICRNSDHFLMLTICCWMIDLAN